MRDNEESIADLIEQLRQLRTHQERLLDRIEARVQRDQAQQETEDLPYRVGDRVYITNRVRKPVFAKPSWTARAERRASVTKIRGNRVHFKTDNGTTTWRSPENLRPLHDDD